MHTVPLLEPQPRPLSARAVVQVAYAVDDVRDAAVVWVERTGAGPFFVRDHPLMHGLDAAGRDTVLDHSSAFGQWGQVQVELIAVHPGTSASLRALVPPAGVLHHVTWFADDVSAEVERLTPSWPAVLRGRTSSGLAFAFLDARPDLGHLVEIYEPSPRLLDLYDRVAAASRGWDGTVPVRLLDGAGGPRDESEES